MELPVNVCLFSSNNSSNNENLLAKSPRRLYWCCSRETVAFTDLVNKDTQSRSLHLRVPLPTTCIIFFLPNKFQKCFWFICKYAHRHLMVTSVYVHRFEIAFAVTMDKTFLHNPHSANCEKRRTNEWTGQGELQKKKTQILCGWEINWFPSP